MQNELEGLLEDVKEETRRIENNLLEYMEPSNIDYYADWVFSYAHAEGKIHGINGRHLEYLCAVRRNQLAKIVYEHILDENEVILPPKKEIKRLLLEGMKIAG